MPAVPQDAESGNAKPQETSSSTDRPGELVGGLIASPWWFVQTLHNFNMAWYHVWARHFLCSGFPDHPHESGAQLELPDPLAASPAPELFA